MIFELRHYQELAVKKIIDSVLNHPQSNPLCVAPCGAGKSLIIATLVSRLIEHQILVITPRKKLLQQNAQYISDHGVCSAAFGDDTGHNHNVILGTYQTLINRDIKHLTLLSLMSVIWCQNLTVRMVPCSLAIPMLS